MVDVYGKCRYINIPYTDAMVPEKDSEGKAQTNIYMSYTNHKPIFFRGCNPQMPLKNCHSANGC